MVISICYTLFVFKHYISERLHLEQQGAVKMKCWRRNKTQKKSLELKPKSSKKLTSNVLLESLSMLDLPTSSTSDSMPSSSTSPVLSDMNMHFTQEITSLENLKQSIKVSQNVKNHKKSIQDMQTIDNTVELNIECPTISVDQKKIETSQVLTMSVSNDVSTITASSTITTSKITSQSNIGKNSGKSIHSSFTSQPTTSNISNCQSVINNMISKSIANNVTSQSIANSITSHSITSNIISQSIANTNQKFINTQAGVANNGHVINITQSMSSNSQTLVSSNKLVGVFLLCQ